MIDVDADGGRSDEKNVLRTWLTYDEDGGTAGTAALNNEWLLPFLLLSLRGRDLYGSELLQKIGDLGFGAVRSGEVYMILWKAEKEGLVFFEPGDAEHVLSRWKYGLTEVGEAYLEFLANSLESYSKEIEVFFRAYDGHALHEVRG